MLFFVAYVAGLAAMVAAGARHPRWRWQLLVVGLLYVAVPVVALLAFLFLLSRTTTFG
jgi:hypothetical protein